MCVCVTERERDKAERKSTWEKRKKMLACPTPTRSVTMVADGQLTRYLMDLSRLYRRLRMGLLLLVFSSALWRRVGPRLQGRWTSNHYGFMNF